MSSLRPIDFRFIEELVEFVRAREELRSGHLHRRRKLLGLTSIAAGSYEPGNAQSLAHIASLDRDSNRR